MKLIKLIMSRMTLVLALILLLWSVAFYLNLSNRLYYIVDTGLRAFASDRISEFLVSPGKDSAVQLDTAGIYTYSIASVPETYALANYGVSIRNQSEQSAGVERAQQRNLRAIFNRAIDEEIIPQGMYPFRRFKIKKESTPKRSLTVEELRMLRDYPCEEWQEKWRDMFMLIFYLIGINTVDLMALTEVQKEE